MSVCNLIKAKAQAAFLILCMLVCGHDPVVVAAVAGSTDQPDLLRMINDQELVLRDLRDQVQAISLPTKLRNSDGKPYPTKLAPAKNPDKVETFMKRWRAWSKAHLSRVLLSDGVFWLSIFAILQWHARVHFGDFFWFFWRRCTLRKNKWRPLLFPRKLGMHVLILVIYYDADLPIPNWLYDCVRGRVFLTSIFLIYFESFALYYGFMLLGWSLRDRSSARSRYAWRNPLDSKEEDGISRPKYRATNIYEDLTRRFVRVFPTFISQLTLVCLYMQNLNIDSRTHDVQQVNFNYWLAAVIFQMYAGDAGVGEPFNGRYWRLILQSRTSQPSVDQSTRGLISYAREFLGLDSTNTFELVSQSNRVGGINVGEEERRRKQEVEEEYLKESFEALGGSRNRIFWCIPLKFIHEWHLRRVMDVVINSISRSVILYTVPIMVSVEEPLDFVKDLTAVLFIIVLYNVEDRSLKEILVKLKFGLFYNRDEREDAPISVALKRVVELKDEERQHIEENWEQYGDISMIAPDEWDAFLGLGNPKEVGQSCSVWAISNSFGFFQASSRRSPSRLAD